MQFQLSDNFVDKYKRKKPPELRILVWAGVKTKGV